MTPRERGLAIATGSVLAGAAVFLGWLEPRYQAWKELDDQAAVLEQALERDRERAASVRALADAREELDALLQTPGGASVVPAFIAHIRSLSAGAGFEPEALRYLSAEPLGSGSPFAELRFELRAKTEPKRLTAFLVALVASERPVRVASVSVTPEPTGEDVDVSLSLLALVPSSVLREATQ